MYETPAVQPQPKKKRNTLLIVLVAVFAVLALCVGGTVIVGVATDSAEKAANVTASSTPNAQQPVVAATTAAAPTTPAAPPPPPPPPPPPAVPTIEDGTWTVGVDIPAGTYRTTTNVGTRCYWAIYKSGTNGSEIIENDFPGGGRPSVTLRAGQDFRTARCGKWSKVG